MELPEPPRAPGGEKNRNSRVFNNSPIRDSFFPLLLDNLRRRPKKVPRFPPPGISPPRAGRNSGVISVRKPLEIGRFGRGFGEVLRAPRRVNLSPDRPPEVFSVSPAPDQRILPPFSVSPHHKRRSPGRCKHQPLHAVYPPTHHPPPTQND